jgi:hypothetical protein
MHPPAVVVSRTTAESWSSEADSTPAAGNSAPAEVTSAETATTEAASSAVASCPSDWTEDKQREADYTQNAFRFHVLRSVPPSFAAIVQAGDFPVLLRSGG